jgi:hypothetical protein
MRFVDCRFDPATTPEAAVIQEMLETREGYRKLEMSLRQGGVSAAASNTATTGKPSGDMA